MTCPVCIFTEPRTRDETIHNGLGPPSSITNFKKLPLLGCYGGIFSIEDPSFQMTLHVCQVDLKLASEAWLSSSFLTVSDVFEAFLG